jgi:hypothetical protein
MSQDPTDPHASVDRPPVSPPSVWQQAGSLAGAMARFAASGFKTVDAEIHQARVARCEPCEYRRNNRCVMCGCFLDKKAWLPFEDCPLGRWVT